MVERADSHSLTKRLRAIPFFAGLDDAVIAEVERRAIRIRDRERLAAMAAA